MFQNLPVLIILMWHFSKLSTQKIFFMDEESITPCKQLQNPCYGPTWLSWPKSDLTWAPTHGFSELHILVGWAIRIEQVKQLRGIEVTGSRYSPLTNALRSPRARIQKRTKTFAIVSLLETLVMLCLKMMWWNVDRSTNFSRSFDEKWLRNEKYLSTEPRLFLTRKWMWCDASIKEFEQLDKQRLLITGDTNWSLQSSHQTEYFLDFYRESIDSTRNQTPAWSQLPKAAAASWCNCRFHVTFFPRTQVPKRAVSARTTTLSNPNRINQIPNGLLQKSAYHLELSVKLDSMTRSVVINQVVYLAKRNQTKMEEKRRRYWRP